MPVPAPRRSDVEVLTQHTDMTERALVFWGVCIPTRTLIALHAMRRDAHMLRAAAVVVGGRWVAGYENSHVGRFGGPAWWADERRLHGLLWLMYAATGRGECLLVDTVVGAGNWVWHKG